MKMDFIRSGFRVRRVSSFAAHGFFDSVIYRVGSKAAHPTRYAPIATTAILRPSSAL